MITMVTSSSLLDKSPIGKKRKENVLHICLIHLKSNSRGRTNNYHLCHLSLVCHYSIFGCSQTEWRGGFIKWQQLLSPRCAAAYWSLGQRWGDWWGSFNSLFFYLVFCRNHTLNLESPSSLHGPEVRRGSEPHKTKETWHTRTHQQKTKKTKKTWESLHSINSSSWRTRTTK